MCIDNDEKVIFIHNDELVLIRKALKDIADQFRVCNQFLSDLYEQARSNYMEESKADEERVGE